MTTGKVLVAGAGGALGREIVGVLRAGGREVLATYRTPRDGLEDALRALGATPVRLDLADTDMLSLLLDDVDGAIFTPILTASAPAARRLRDGHRSVFFSSNNAAIDTHAEVYRRLREAEEAVRRDAPHATILRPTMIYGYPGDGNMTKLITAMRRWPLTPLPGDGSALQQPVFYKDLAAAAVAALHDDSAGGRLRAVAGPAPVTQRALYEAAARAAGVRLRTVGVPLRLGAALVNMAARAGLRLPVSAAQLRRAGADKTPSSKDPILGTTSLENGLAALAAALDADRPGA